MSIRVLFVCFSRFYPVIKRIKYFKVSKSARHSGRPVSVQRETGVATSTNGRKRFPLFQRKSCAARLRRGRGMSRAVERWMWSGCPWRSRQVRDAAHQGWTLSMNVFHRCDRYCDLPAPHRIYRVSKTSHLWLAITLTHMNGFWYFLAEMLPIK